MPMLPRPMFRATFCCLIAFLALSVRAQTIELKEADRLASDHYVARYSTLYWIDAVQRATHGAVSIKRYPSESLGKAKDMLTLLKAGITDIGEIFPGYLGDPMLLSTVGELPGILPNACAASLAYYQLSRPGGFFDTHELAPQGLHMLYVVGLPAYQLFTSKKFDNLDSMRGLKIRSSGPGMDAGLRRLGMVPIRMGGAEINESFNRGTVDGMAFPAASISTYGLDAKTAYGTGDLSFGSSITFYVISTKAWNKLPAPIQQAMTDAGEETTRHACKLIDQEEQEALKKLAGGHMTLVRLSPADRRRFDEELAVVADEWAGTADKRGFKGTEALKAFRAAVKPYL